MPKRPLLKYFLGVVLLISAAKSNAMQPLTDNEMQQSSGQALLSLSYISPTEGNNPNQNVGFYRMMMEANIELNANIKRLQLGCGGSKGSGCDIDIEDLSLTGVNPVNGQYANTDALINNPFIEFAIKSPESASTRELVGIRLGALNILGKLGLGSNTDLNTLADDVGGIKSLSGDVNITMTNTILGNIVIGGGLARTEAYINDYNKLVILNRSTTATLDKISAKTGPLRIFGLLNLASGLTLNNATLKDYPLSGFHEVLLSKDEAGTIPTSDLYLSLQKQVINWQKISTHSFTDTVPAQTGWWLSLPRLFLTDIETQERVDIPLSDAASGLFGRELIINPMDSGQRGIKNCYGGLTFC